VTETKTLRYARAHAGRTVQAARWLGRRRHRYPRGVVPVVCITRARWVERFEYGALVVSLDRLVPALYAAARRDRAAGDGRRLSRFVELTAQPLRAAPSPPPVCAGMRKVLPTSL
jgi:hypothetical protein